MSDIDMKLSSTTLSAEIDERLEEAIINGHFRPGQRLIAEELADDFGVSRIPVRESLRALNAAGWVEIRPRHGVYVRRWSRIELTELFEVRKLLEGESARLAAGRRNASHLEQLKVNRSQYEDAISSDGVEVPKLNRDFHQLIAQAAGNQVLTDHLDKIGRRVQWYFSSVTEARSPGSAAEHRSF
jgi:DNA-binding GntR family transcriptional regulator